MAVTIDDVDSQQVFSSDQWFTSHASLKLRLVAQTGPFPVSSIYWAKTMRNRLAYLIIAVTTLCLVALLRQQTSLRKTTVVYRAVGDHQVLADIYRPAGTDVLPIIVWMGATAMPPRVIEDFRGS